MSERKCMVTTHIGVDIDAFVAEMNNLGRESVHVPERAVAISDMLEESGVNTEFMLTEEERQELINDPRVRAAEYIPDNIKIVRRAQQLNSFYNLGDFIDNQPEYSWAQASCDASVNPFASSSTLANQVRNYTLAGGGVDIIVYDSGIEAEHPEWLAADGVTSRFQRIDWTSPTFAPGNVTNAPNMYTDVNGHGTACISSIAGKRYGWASDANIYSMSIDYGDSYPNSTFSSTLYGFQRINAFHRAKPIEATGYRRPTIVSLSWGYVAPMVNYLVGNVANNTANLVGEYRGNSFSIPYYCNVNDPYDFVYPDPAGNAFQQAAADLQDRGFLGYLQYVPAAGGSVYTYNGNVDQYVASVVTSIDAEIDACIANGVIFITSAGNDGYKVSSPDDPDWNNYIVGNTGTGTYYYHRGGSPVTSNAIVVGATEIGGSDRKAYFSRCGPGIDIYAPGSSLPAAASTQSNIYYSKRAYEDGTSGYSEAKVSGTSFSAPSVGGWLATMAGARPHLNQDTARQLLADTALANRLVGNSGAPDFDNYANVYDFNSNNRDYLYNPFNSSTVTTINNTSNVNIRGSF